MGLALLWGALEVWRSPVIFLQQLKLASSNFVRSWHLPSPIAKLYPQKMGVAMGYVSPRKFVGSRLIFFAMAETSDFKLGTQLGFANKAHHKITHMKKVGHGMVLYKIWHSL